MLVRLYSQGLPKSRTHFVSEALRDRAGKLGFSLFAAVSRSVFQKQKRLKVELSKLHKFRAVFHVSKLIVSLLFFPHTLKHRHDHTHCCMYRHRYVYVCMCVHMCVYSQRRGNLRNGLHSCCHATQCCHYAVL